MALKQPVKAGIVTLLLLLVAFLPVTAQEQAVPAYNPNNLIRLHVVANSDSATDQALKQKVRDEIVRNMGPEFRDAGDVAAARKVAEADLEYIRALAARRVQAEGKDYPVSVELGRYPFPTRSYGYFVLPAGDYEAVRVIIGQGNGTNWWCVLFPPLCFVDLSREAVPICECKETGSAFGEGVNNFPPDPVSVSGVVEKAGQSKMMQTSGGDTSERGASAEPPKIIFRFKIVEILHRLF